MLTSYTIKKILGNLTPISSHFRTCLGAGFVLGAFDNMNMKGRYPILGTKTTDYCALVVFQDADDTLTQQTDVTDYKISRRLMETLPC